jgi:transcriptional regulator with XRE-family HTH domain
VNPRQRFAVNLRRFRTELSLSQEELAFRCDLHRTEISLLERGGREPRLGTIVKLATVLETTPSALCEGVSWLSEDRRFNVQPPPFGGGASDEVRRGDVG